MLPRQEAHFLFTADWEFNFSFAAIGRIQYIKQKQDISKHPYAAQIHIFLYLLAEKRTKDEKERTL